MSNLTALRQARYSFEHKATATPEERVNRAIELAEWSLFSNRQIARLTGLHDSKVAGYTGKSDHTGGRLPGEALPHLIAAVEALGRNEMDVPALRAAIGTGASHRMVARLTGIPATSIRRYVGEGVAA